MALLDLLAFCFFSLSSGACTVIKVGKSAAGPSAGAPSSSSLMNYMVPTMTKARKDAADRRFVLWCCIDLRPEQLRFDQGFKLFLGSLSPEYVTTTMAKSTFNQTLDELYGTVLSSVVGELRTLREENLGMGYSGPFLGAQLDLTTAAGEEYITFTVTFVKKGDTDMTRIALATRAFPGSHTAEDVQPWIEKVRRIGFVSWLHVRLLSRVALVFFFCFSFLVS